MFENMQKLPICYFDSHTHGDIMSLYTNDTDALRQMIAQSMAQLISSAFTITAVFVCMLNISIWLTIVVLVVLFLVMQFAGIIMKKSGRYFMAQQKTLADLDGYIAAINCGKKIPLRQTVTAAP